MLTYPNAKINLGLNVTEKRPDGYHNLETVFFPIPVTDALEVMPATDPSLGECQLHLSGLPVEGDTENNLVVRVYHILKELLPQLPAVEVHLFKQLPTGAGLGGGSADAAFMMRLMNERFTLGLTPQRMAELLTPVGADCPFFVYNTPMRATGIGNILTPIRLSLAGYHLVLVKPDEAVSTAEAYRLVTPKRPEVSLSDIIQQPVETWKDSLVNDFEKSVFLSHPIIAAIKDRLYDLGAVYAAMSGSGSAVFGLFKEPVKDVDNQFSGLFCRQRQLM